jgi:formylglycine-generating enzyme required for sulfatase activity
MMKNYITKIIGFWFITVVCFAFNPLVADAGSIQQGDLFSSINGEQSIEINAINELKYTSNGKDTLARYGLDGNLMRMTYKDANAIVVRSYEITEGGLTDKSGQVLYSKVGLNAIKRMEAEKLKDIARAPSVFVKGGCFDMGDTFGDGDSDEGPVHRVCVDDFKIDKYHVTQQAFAKTMQTNPSHFKGCANCPMDSVTWYEAKNYCKKIGKRLATEAEFEYVSREGGKEVKFGTGQSAISAQKANFSGDRIVAVGSYPANTLGIHDLSGNVWEWTGDWYRENYYAKSPESNPTGSWIGKEKVLRGGKYSSKSRFLRASNRSYGDPSARCHEAGFRCAQ